MTAVRITQDVLLLIATALLAFAASGENQSAFLFVGYLCFGMIAPVLLLHRGQMTASLVAWVVLMLLFAFIFDSDRMLNVDYRPTTIGQAMLWAVPIVAVVVRLSYWLIDRLRLRGPDGVARQRGRRPAAGAGGTGGGTIGKANHPAYPWLIGCWLLWPTGTAAIASSLRPARQSSPMRFASSGKPRRAIASRWKLWLSLPMPPTYIAVSGRIASSAPCTSSVVTATSRSLLVSVSSRCIDSRKFTTAPWGIWTPFGVPVDPDV